MLDSHQREQLHQYSQSIDALNLKLGKCINLYTNNVLSKDPYAGGGFIALLKNKHIPTVSFSRKLFYTKRRPIFSMTISVRLSEEIEKLRDEAQNEKKNISEIVNSALEKYYFMHKYFDSIHAHHLDPVVLAEFFKLADTPEKVQKIADAGAIMTNKFISYHDPSNDSLSVHLELVEKFLKIHIKNKLCIFY